MRGPRDKNNAVVDDSFDDETVVDDSEDIELLNVEYCDEECQINEAFGDIVSELVQEGFDINQLFDPDWDK